jgi:hypothetical protein
MVCDACGTLYWSPPWWVACMNTGITCRSSQTLKQHPDNERLQTLVALYALGVIAAVSDEMVGVPPEPFTVVTLGREDENLLMVTPDALILHK